MSRLDIVGEKKTVTFGELPESTAGKNSTPDTQAMVLQVRHTTHYWAVKCLNSIYLLNCQLGKHYWLNSVKSGMVKQRDRCTTNETSTQSY